MGDALSANDPAYAGTQVAQHAGIAQEAAQARVATTYQGLLQTRAALDAAAKRGKRGAQHRDR